MTDSPPPGMAPPELPPPSAPQRKEPGFMFCGALFLVGVVVVGGIASAITQAAGNASWVANAVGLSILAGLIMLSIRDVRFAKCLLKGAAVFVAVFAVLAGACVALLAGSGL